MSIYSSIKTGCNTLTAILFLLVILLAFSLTPTLVLAEEVADGGGLAVNERTYQGTINFVHQEAFEIVVDDHSFQLNRTLRFENSTWSSEQVVQKLEAGQRVSLELGVADESDSSLRLVQGIDLINQ